MTTAALVSAVSNMDWKAHVVIQPGKSDGEVQKGALTLRNLERMGSPIVPTTTTLLKEDLRI